MSDPLLAIRTLAAPEELQPTAPAGFKANAHIHLPPNFSAFETTAQAVNLAAQQGLSVLGTSNYYDFDAYVPFAEACNQRRIFPLFGLELICLLADLLQAKVKINDPSNPGKMYLCGKAITRFAPMSPQAHALLEIIRRNDSKRMAQMSLRLAKVFETHGLNTGLDAAQITARIVSRHGCPAKAVYLQERHVAQAFQEVLFERTLPEARRDSLARILGATPSVPQDPVQVQNDLRAQLLKTGRAAFVEETFITFEQAYRLVLELGGIPCYPVLADGATPICAYEQPVGELLAKLKAAGIHAAEFIPSRNRPEVLLEYVGAMRRAGLVVSAGTEHNTLSLLSLEPSCLNGAPIPEAVQAIFREGACVLAAHQFLTLHGRCGLVDQKGRPNPDYADAEQRIAGLSKLGAAVIEKYCSRSKDAAS